MYEKDENAYMDAGVPPERNATARRLLAANPDAVGSTNAKDNFRFERMIVGWRERPVVDLRRKR